MLVLTEIQAYINEHVTTVLGHIYTGHLKNDEMIFVMFIIIFKTLYIYQLWVKGLYISWQSR
jgi:hypothetical protein